jgi:hypothetical protein
MILGLAFALIIGAPQQDSRSSESQATMQQQAHDRYERGALQFALILDAST